MITPMWKLRACSNPKTFELVILPSMCPHSLSLAYCLNGKVVLTLCFFCTEWIHLLGKDQLWDEGICVHAYCLIAGMWKSALDGQEKRVGKEQDQCLLQTTRCRREFNLYALLCLSRCSVWCLTESRWNTSVQTLLLQRGTSMHSQTDAF